MKGRKPKPTALKIRDGNPGRRPLPTAEPTAARKLPRPPREANARDRALWIRTGKMLIRSGVATRLDSAAFRLLIESLVTHRNAVEKVAEFGPVWMEKGESKIPKFQYSPWWVIQNREFDKLKWLLTEFGLTPSSRTRLHGTPAAPEEDSNPLTAILKIREGKRRPG
jgi:P27 family predicted phage terminase small subunit